MSQQITTLGEIIKYISNEFPSKDFAAYFDTRHLQSVPEHITETTSPRDRAYKKRKGILEEEKKKVLSQYLHIRLKDGFSKETLETELESYFLLPPERSNNEIYDKTFDNLIEIYKKAGNSSEKVFDQLIELFEYRIMERIDTDKSISCFMSNMDIVTQWHDI